MKTEISIMWSCLDSWPVGMVTMKVFFVDWSVQTTSLLSSLKNELFRRSEGKKATTIEVRKEMTIDSGEFLVGLDGDAVSL